MKHQFRLFLVLGLAGFALHGCASGVETHVRSQGAGIVGKPALMWQAEPEGIAPDPVVAKAREIVAAHLIQQGFRFADEAPVLVALGVSQRAGHIDVRRTGNVSLSAAQQPQYFPGCRRNLMRLNISLSSNATGEMLYSGSAQEVHCRARLDEALPYLAETALADLAKPAGDRVAISPIRD